MLDKDGIIDEAEELPELTDDVSGGAIEEEPEEPVKENAPAYSLDEDIEELRANCPELIGSVKNTNPERYSELRALGLSPKEAYLATGEHKKPHDTRGHLGDSVPRAAKAPASKISRRELEIARSLFDGMSDEQIIKLYNKVKS